MIVYLLWSIDNYGTRIEEVFADKTHAEATMRMFKEQDVKHGVASQYWIQERKVV